MQDFLDRSVSGILKRDVSARLHIQSFDNAMEKHVPRILNFKVCVQKPGGGSIVIHVENCRWSAPSAVEIDGYVNDNITPDECVERALDYQMTAIVDLTCYDSADQPASGKNVNVEHMQLLKRWRGVPYFSMPCMVGSLFCNTRRSAIDSNPLRGGRGGCFVISGQMKHLVLPTHLRKNVIVARVASRQLNCITKVTWEFRSDIPERHRATSTLRGEVDVRKGITVKLPFSDQTLGIASSFGLLTDSVTEELLREMLLPYGDDEPKEYVNFISDTSALKPAPAGSASEAIVASNPRLDVPRLVESELLPHAETIEKKMVLLGLAARHAAMVFLGILPPGCRDSAVYTRMSTPAVILCEYIRSVNESLFRPKLARLFATKLAAGVMLVDELPSHLPTNNALSSKIRTAILTGRFTLQVGGDDPISRSNLMQTAQTMNSAALVGHQAKTIKPVNREGKDVTARLAGPDHWHVWDMADSTEGATCGLLNTRCGLSRVRLMERRHGLVEKMLELLFSDRAASSTGTWVLFNGKPLWRTDDPQRLCNTIRAARRDGRIPFDVGVAWVYRGILGMAGEVRVLYDPGEVLSPLFVVEKLDGLKRLSTECANLPPEAAWDEMVARGMIEYVGIEEALCDSGVVAEVWREANPAFHMWSEVEPSLSLLGSCTVFTPAADRNQGPRNSYHANMKKQAHAPAASGPSHETLQYSIDYPQVSHPHRTTRRTLASACVPSASTTTLVALYCAGQLCLACKTCSFLWYLLWSRSRAHDTRMPRNSLSHAFFSLRRSHDAPAARNIY